jgi:ATP-dependent Clp protease ATP-binding subunit ClpA
MIGERFTKAARRAVQGAVEEAQRDKAGQITTAHLMLALLDSPVLAGYDLPRAELEEAFRAARRKGGLSEADTAALRELGIDVDQIVHSVERVMGEGALATGESPRKRRVFRDHLPFDDAMKKTLERSLAEARDLGNGYLGDGHLLLALLSGGGFVPEVLEARGVTYTELRKRVAGTA